MTNKSNIADEIQDAFEGHSMEFTDPWQAFTMGYVLGMCARVYRMKDPVEQARALGRIEGVLFAWHQFTLTEFERSAKDGDRPIFHFEAGNKVAEKEK